MTPRPPRIPSYLARAVWWTALALALALSVGRSLAPAVGLGPAAVAVPSTVAAAPELQINGDALYEVLPARARVHITLDATVSNTHQDTGTARTYFDTAYLAVLPGTANFRASSPGATAGVSIREQTNSYTLLTLDLGRRLYAGSRTPFKLQFDLPDLGGTAIRDVRVGASLVAFPVWAFATDDTPGGSVSVVFPPGYNVQQQVGTLPDPTDGEDGTLIFASGELKDPLRFYSYFVADRPGAFAETDVSSSVGGVPVAVTVRAWSDDEAWAARTGALVKRGLPVLGSAIGLPYSGSGLVIEESASRTIGGYAGLFDPVDSTIQVAYYADPFVVLHEAAHAWFNGRLAADRWILEGFASWYAQRAAEELKIDARPPVLTAAMRKAAIPLNAWPAVGRADETTEDYAYAATFAVAQAIAGRAGPAGLRDVWRAAVNGENAYQPVHDGSAAEPAAGVPDWRGFLDLLEERTDATYTDLWRQWVVRPDDASLLEDRATARAAYASAVESAGDWELPPTVRRAMAAWQFDQAKALMLASKAVLVQRQVIADAAAAIGLTPPPTLRAAFEGPDGPAAASAEAGRELEAIQAIASAAAARGAAAGLLAQVGLVARDPGSALAAARAAFEAGDPSTAIAHAQVARSDWLSGEERGQARLATVVAIAASIVVLVVAVTVIVRGRRRRVEDDDG